ncbi:MAG: TolC family protein [Bacteroidales bacterium]|nr:TolC family protein [Bacteroidales bacterium]
MKNIIKRKQQAVMPKALPCARILNTAKPLIISMLFTLIIVQVTAQSEVETVMKAIETNSTALSALREQMEAQKLGARTDIYLQNPEIEFNYLWGNPSSIGNRTDINITQSFDFPTAYGYRNKISKLENANAELLYKSGRINLLLRAKQVCIELVYYNALAKEYAARLTNAERIAAAFQALFDKGDANVIENNKAKLNLTTVRNEIERIEIEKTSLLNELQALNGGIEIPFATAEYSDHTLPASFSHWYGMAESKNPVLQYVRREIEIGQQQVKLNTALGLPKFNAGYMSEKVDGERYQGITVGVSVPLWENRNRVKQAKAQVRAAEKTLEDTKIQFYSNLQNLFVKSSRLRQNALQYRHALSAYSNNAFLQKALDAGELSLLNYLLEIEYYYDAMNNMMEAERDFNLSLAELSAVEL